MKKYTLLKILVIITLASFSFFMVPAFTNQTLPTIYIDPPSTSLPTGNNAMINVTIKDAFDVCSWEFKIFYRNDILSGTQIVEGSFLKSGGATFFWIQNFTDNYNSTHGIAWVACTRSGWTGPGVNGSGNLAEITFKAIAGGTTIIHLSDTVLGNSTAQPISHTTADGLVEVKGSDVAITIVAPFKTIVGQSLNLHINITIQNQGDSNDTFNTTAYANTTEIETREITLASGNSTTVTFTWNTTGVAKGNYTIKAHITPLPSETDTTDNTLTDGTVLVTIPGDVNGDRKVRVDDVLAIALAFGNNYGDPDWDQVKDCDVNCDLKIRVDDVLIAALNFGEGPW